MNLDTNGTNFIKNHEGSCQLKAYTDVAGYLTVGWGHKVTPSDPVKNVGDTITQAQADAFFTSDVSAAVNCVNGFPTIGKMSQTQFNALVDLFFNIGVNHSSDADIVNVIKNPNTYVLPPSEATLNSITTAFTYTMAGGVRVQGLVNRRNDEIYQFMLGMINTMFIPNYYIK